MSPTGRCRIQPKSSYLDRRENGPLGARIREWGRVGWMRPRVLLAIASWGEGKHRVRRADDCFVQRAVTPERHEIMTQAVGQRQPVAWFERSEAWLLRAAGDSVSAGARVLVRLAVD
jgi:hypothetical protein